MGYSSRNNLYGEPVCRLKRELYHYGLFHTIFQQLALFLDEEFLVEKRKPIGKSKHGKKGSQKYTFVYKISLEYAMTAHIPSPLYSSKFKRSSNLVHRESNMPQKFSAPACFSSTKLIQVLLYPLNA